MTGVSFDGRVLSDLEQQLTALREDIAQLTAHATRLTARVVQLEAALRLVRDLMRDLPAHDHVSPVAVRLRSHFDYLATNVIDDALGAPRLDPEPTAAGEDTN